MKTISLFFMSCLVALSILACNRNGGNNDAAVPPVVAQPPPPACVPGTLAYDPNCTGYNGYAQYGFQAYGYGLPYNRGFGYCNCNTGFRPVYGHMGLGCVQMEQIRPFVGAYFYMGAIPNNYQTVNIPQVSNITGYPQMATANCFDNVAISCFVTQANSCGAGRLCRPTGPGSALGICVNQ